MSVLYSNNASSKLSASITNSTTSFSVTAGTGALFPSITGSDFFYATLVDASNNIEIVKVTARSTDTFTVARAQDGTSARAWSANDTVELRITKAMLDQLKLDAYGSASASETPPSNPVDGRLWWNSGEGSLKVYFGGSWVDAASVDAATSYPASSTSAYTGQYVLTGTTTNATETEIFIEGVSNSRVPVSTNKASHYRVEVIGRRTDVIGDVASFELRSVVLNNAGVVTDIGNVYEIVVARTDANMAVDVRADDANNAIGVFVTGVAGKTISWRAVMTTMEV